MHGLSTPVSSLSVVLCCLGTSAATSVSADTIRFTVGFAVAGDPQDPDFGTETATGLFSVVTHVPPGVGFSFVEDWESGLDADVLSLTFAGTSWTTANADVGRLIFLNETFFGWQLGGIPAGLGGVSYDISPDIGVGNFYFDYTTDRSLQLGHIFVGQLLGWSVTATPMPEPSLFTVFAISFLAIIHAHWVGFLTKD